MAKIPKNIDDLLSQLIVETKLLQGEISRIDASNSKDVKTTLVSISRKMEYINALLEYLIRVKL